MDCFIKNGNASEGLLTQKKSVQERLQKSICAEAFKEIERSNNILKKDTAQNLKYYG